MTTVTTKDGTQIFYKDWGKGQTIVFSHGWPLSADDWDGQMLFFGQRGYRVIAHDRRGHGRSAQTCRCHPMLKTEKNPTGQPVSAFDELRAALAANRPQFYRDITLPFYGYNRPGAKISEGIREHWWLQGMLGGMKAHYDCIKAFSETDFTEDLKKIDIPVLVMHGDDDQIVPIVAAGPLSAKLLKKSTLKVYPGFPHGMPATNADTINADLLSFFKGSATATAA